MADKSDKLFVTPEEFTKTKKRDLSGPNGWLLFIACNSGIDFAKAVRREYETMLREYGSSLNKIPLLGTHKKPVTQIFTDTETRPRMAQHVAGSDAFVFQCCHEKKSDNSVNENIQQLLQVVRTLRAHRAKTITVVSPYTPYSRQDKPSFMKREATLASLFADQLKAAGADIYLTYHPHTMALSGFYEPQMKFVALSGLDLFISMFEDKMGCEDVVAVSTDAGGAKFTVHFANAMKTPYAIANKFRAGKDKSNLIGVIGDMSSKKVALVTDDETVTGSSILNTVESLNKSYGIEEIFVAISHAKIDLEHIPRFIKAHAEYGLSELHVTDTVPQRKEFLDLDFVVEHSLAHRFAASINRLHYNQSVSQMFYKL
jgi:ribose-phosphate pyrophosphokinase